MLMIPPTEQIAGPAGELEVLYVPAAKQDAPLAVICHPHPLHGGTLTNKVVTTLARTFSECGAHTLRFNFRGVGKSAGSHDDGRGELLDLLRVIEWGREQAGPVPLWLAGFSFGAFIAMKGALHPDVSGLQQLVLVSPQITRLALVDVTHVPCPWILVQGDKDEVVSAPDVYRWCEGLAQPPLLVRMPEAGHFYHGQLGALRQQLKECLSSNENNSHLY